MTIARAPSKLTLPAGNTDCATALAYLIKKFPAITADIWHQRAADGKIHWHDGELIRADSSYRPQQRVYYYREVVQEPEIPFEEQIIFQDQHLLVADKPHFLPVTPGGIYVNECLQNRLRHRTGIEELQALHRLDRPTAGLVLFAISAASRGHYQQLFAQREVDKRYQAIARIDPQCQIEGQHWQVETRISRSQPRFLMKNDEGEPNSHSQINCRQQRDDRALFELQPITGKTHQLRLHMQAIGHPILNDRYYPSLQDERPDDYRQPLQLLAQKISFTDPITGQRREFSSRQRLRLD